MLEPPDQMPVIKIGESKVLETGSLILHDWAATASIELHGLLFHLQVLASQDPPMAHFAEASAHSITARFVGDFGITGCYWRFEDVATIFGLPVSLFVLIKQLQSATGTPPVFAIEYTFSQASQALASIRPGL